MGCSRFSILPATALSYGLPGKLLDDILLSQLFVQPLSIWLRSWINFCSSSCLNNFASSRTANLTRSWFDYRIPVAICSCSVVYDLTRSSFRMLVGCISKMTSHLTCHDCSFAGPFNLLPGRLTTILLRAMLSGTYLQVSHDE